MVDLIIVAVLLIIMGAAILYIVKAKKSGAKCIGCPDSGSCSHVKVAGDGRNCNGSCAGCSSGCGTKKV